MDISLLNTLFYVSMAVAVMGLVLAIFFFFYFDIPTVYAMMTGKARKETVRRMEEQNARTGRLRTVHGHTEKTGKTGKIGKTGRTGMTGKVRSAEVAHPAAPAYQPQPAAYQDRMETSVLSQAAPETNVLGSTTAETAMLNRPAPAAQESNQTTILHQAAPAIPFYMTETTLVIHTDEII